MCGMSVSSCTAACSVMHFALLLVHGRAGEDVDHAVRRAGERPIEAVLQAITQGLAGDESR